MNQYKPEFLGKVIPADDPSKLTTFCMDKFDAFNKIYDVCKDQSAQIGDIKAVESESSDPTSLSVKVSADKEAVAKIIETAKGDASISIKGDVITADPKKT